MKTDRTMTPTTLPRLAHLAEGSVILDLDGSTGTNRVSFEACQISAQNDIQAIQCWLAEYRGKSTHRLYQKEAERLLLWCLYQHHTPLSSLTQSDLEAYFHFLADPQPQEQWCAPKGGRGRLRGQPHWRPFVGPLSPSSKALTITVLRSLFDYLVASQYLSFNPFTIMRRRQRQNPYFEESKLTLHERLLDLAEWCTFQDVLEDWPASTAHKKDDTERLRFLVTTLYFLGLRIHELESHTWAAFRQIEGKWWFYVRGKGDKVGRIPVNDAYLDVISRYRRHLRCDPLLPEPGDTRPLIMNWNTGAPMTARTMNHHLKRLAYLVAEQFPDQPERQQKLQGFSAHWLRHLSASMQDRAGISFKHVRSNLRHENDHTTRLYVHAIDQERHEDMQKLRLRPEMPVTKEEGIDATTTG